MAKSRYMSRFKWLIVIVLLTIITVGVIYMFTLNKKSEEERRNREYEVSLVKALKNSYEGIEEIYISNPSYTSIPSEAWGADVKLKFFDGTLKEHVLAFDKNVKKISKWTWNAIET